jgi:PKD repeat protein
MRRSISVLLAIVWPGQALAEITATVTGPGAVGEGGEILLSGVASSDNPLCTSFSYAWDLDNDGAYDDASTQDATFSALLLDGPDNRTVGLQVTATSLGCLDSPDTDSHAISIDNLAPAGVNISGLASVDEGTAALYDLVYSDVAADSHTLSWDWGDGGPSSSTASASHTWMDEGAYTVTATVTDDDGGTSSDTHTVTVSNVAPTLSTAQWSASEEEGQEVTFTASATDPGGDTLTYTWGFGDGGPTATGAEVSHTYADNGVYIITLSVDDGDLGVDTQGGNILIRNEPPEVTSIDGPTEGLEGALLQWGVTFTDPGTADLHKVTWSWGDGSPNVRGLTAEHAYPDDGLYTLSVQVCDDEGECDTDNLEVTITNAEPAIAELTGATQLGEGALETFVCVASDPGSGDTLSYELDLGDGTVVPADTAEHAFPDDGEYTVTCTVTDGDGGADTLQVLVTADNVAPVIQGVPPEWVAAGATFTFDPSADDVPADELTWELEGPDGMTLDPSGPELVWPTSTADLGDHPVTITVTDDDGASDTLEFVLTVEVLDDDVDGMDDLWEIANDLDPTDPGDALTDADGDGRSNLDEFGAGTDPQRYDGPSVPVVLAPLDGAEVSASPVELVVDNALSPTLETLLYDFEVYDDEGLPESALVAIADDLPEGSSSTALLLDSALQENTWYFWRAAAQDPYTMGDWTAPHSFFYNAVNEAPTAPGLRSPLDGITVADLTPTLELDEATDPDEDTLTYLFELEDLYGTLVDSADGVEGDGEIARWTPEQELVDDTTYCWTAQATDEHGESGPQPPSACFTVDTSNETPLPPTITDPLDQTQVATLAPAVTVTNGVDPEGRPTSHLFELDTATTFDSPALQTQSVPSDPDGSTSWTPPQPLEEDTWYHLRVLATDGAAVSDWAQITFFVNATNSPPSVPGLNNPADGAAFAEGDSLSVINATDPDEQAITYDFQLADTAGAPVQEIQGVVEDSSGFTAWVPGPLAPGRYTWTARATDEGGAASEWATPRALEVLGAEPPRETASDTGTSKGSTGCSCATPTRPGMTLLPLGLLLLARRRR